MVTFPSVEGYLQASAVGSPTRPAPPAKSCWWLCGCSRTPSRSFQAEGAGTIAATRGKRKEPRDRLTWDTPRLSFGVVLRIEAWTLAVWGRHRHHCRCDAGSLERREMPARVGLTYSDYAALPDDGKRYERGATGRSLCRHGPTFDDQRAWHRGTADPGCRDSLSIDRPDRPRSKASAVRRAWRALLLDCRSGEQKRR